MAQTENDILKPQLRFPEFGDSWKVMYGNEVFCQISKRNDGRDLPLLAISQDFGAVPRQMIDYNVVVSDQSVENYKIVEVGDFIISLRSFQGGIEYSNYNGLCSPAYIIIRKKIDIVDLFFKHYFKTYRFIAELNKNLEGLRDGKMISWKQFSEIKLKFPSIPEQQKIADCLSSIDEMISRTQEKIDLLRQYKKGLMQKMFPAKGKNLPELRFKEFEKDGAWDVAKLGDCLVQSPDYGLNLPSVEYSESLPTYLRITDISDNGRYNDSNKVSVNVEITKDFILSEGDIVFVRTGASVGKVYKYKVEDGILVFAGFLIRIKPDEKLLDSEFLFQYTFSSSYKNWVEMVSARSGQPGINSAEYSSLNIPFTSLKEQNKIASVFSLLDEMVENQINKLELLKLHKKGMMQKLFPKKY